MMLMIARSIRNPRAGRKSHVGEATGGGNGGAGFRPALDRTSVAQWTCFRCGLLAAAASAASPAPKPEELQVYGDWTVGCDNGRACQAVGLMPKSWPDDAATIVVARGAEAGAAPEISIIMREGTGTALEVDGKRLPVRLIPVEGEAKVIRADVPALIAAMRSGNQLKVLGANGSGTGTASLKGASAALLYIDDRQQRVGTVTALVRTGAKPASSVPPPPAIPIVRAAPRTTAPPINVGFARIEALRKQHSCTIGKVGGPDSAEVHALIATQSLVLLACGSGAYNVSHVSLRRDPPWPGDQHNAGAVRRESRLVGQGSAHPGQCRLGPGERPARKLLQGPRPRRLRDHSAYAWDGRRFRLVEEAIMGECRGSQDYIRIWRARVMR